METYEYNNQKLTPEQMLEMIAKLEKERDALLMGKCNKEIIPDGLADKYAWIRATNPTVFSKLSTIVRTICFELIPYFNQAPRCIGQKEMTVSQYRRYADIYEQIIGILDKYHIDPPERGDVETPWESDEKTDQRDNDSEDCGVDSDILKKKISEVIYIPWRAYVRLDYYGIHTIGDLIKLTEDDLLRIEWVGEKTVRQIVEQLDGEGLHLADDH